MSYAGLDSMAISRQVVLSCACTTMFVVLFKWNSASFTVSPNVAQRFQLVSPTKSLPPVLLTCQSPCGRLPNLAIEFVSTGVE